MHEPPGNRATARIQVRRCHFLLENQKMTILCSLIPSEIASVRKHFDIPALSLDEVFSELAVARILFLTDLPERDYLLLPKVSPLGLLANLPIYLAEAKKTGKSRLTSPDQIYDLAITYERDRCQLQDLAAKKPHTITLDWTKLSTAIRECAAEVFPLLLDVFPQLGKHQDVDRMRTSLRISR